MTNSNVPHVNTPTVPPKRKPGRPLGAKQKAPLKEKPPKGPRGRPRKIQSTSEDKAAKEVNLRAIFDQVIKQLDTDDPNYDLVFIEEYAKAVIKASHGPSEGH
jgi:hypothetical protein